MESRPDPAVEPQEPTGFDPHDYEVALLMGQRAHRQSLNQPKHTLIYGRTTEGRQRASRLMEQADPMDDTDATERWQPAWGQDEDRIVTTGGVMAPISQIMISFSYNLKTEKVTKLYPKVKLSGAGINNGWYFQQPGGSFTSVPVAEPEPIPPPVKNKKPGKPKPPRVCALHGPMTSGGICKTCRRRRR